MKLNLSLFEAEKLIPFFRETMESMGMENLISPGFISGSGRFLTLRSILKLRGIDRDTFEASLNEKAKKSNNDELAKMQKKLNFLSLLPCGLRNPFKDAFSDFALIYKNEHPGFAWRIEGNVNHEISFYANLETDADPSDLPDILITSDLNSLYHNQFRDKFLGKGIFTNIMPSKGNSIYRDIEFQDPNGEFSMLTCNPLVMVADLTRMEEDEIPVRWGNLLHSRFENRVIMRGDNDFFCNAVLLPVYKDFGLKGIRKMARSIKRGLHPAQMAKLAGTGSREGAAIYIMPLFFANKIKKKEKVRIIWPVDGAIASPVQMLVKKEKIDEMSDVIEFITSNELAKVLSAVDAPPWNPDVPYKSPYAGKLKWVGWEFINDNDLGKVKARIREEFMNVYDAERKG